MQEQKKLTVGSILNNELTFFQGQGMTQCVKCLAYKYENQSSNSQDPYKSQPGLTDSYNVSAWKTEAQGSPVLAV